jgi:mannitol-specific phosphotransferase system IIBC component
MMNFLAGFFSLLPLRWWVALIVSALGIAAICLRVLETDKARAKRAERKKKNELRLLADKISVYGRSIHQRYPTGDVIVSERDLAERLRKRPDAVIIALNLLLNEQKVQRAPLNGYWKLNA